jgi:hypothetical protein
VRLLHERLNLLPLRVCQIQSTQWHATITPEFTEPSWTAAVTICIRHLSKRRTREQSTSQNSSQCENTCAFHAISPFGCQRWHLLIQTLPLWQILGRDVKNM